MKAAEHNSGKFPFFLSSFLLLLLHAELQGRLVARGVEWGEVLRMPVCLL